MRAGIASLQGRGCRGLSFPAGPGFSAKPLEVTSAHPQASPWAGAACGVDPLHPPPLGQPSNSSATPSLFLEQFVCGPFAGAGSRRPDSWPCNLGRLWVFLEPWGSLWPRAGALRLPAGWGLVSEVGPGTTDPLSLPTAGPKGQSPLAFPLHVGCLDPRLTSPLPGACRADLGCRTVGTQQEKK